MTERKQLLQRVHSAHTARSGREHSVLTVRTKRPHGDYSVLDFLFIFIFILSNPILQT